MISPEVSSSTASYLNRPRAAASGPNMKSSEDQRNKYWEKANTLIWVYYSREIGNPWM